MKMIKSCVFVCFFLAACFNLYAQSGESWDPIEKDVKPSGTLPVVYINTENSAPIDQKINYIPATAWIADPQGVYNLGSELEPVTLGIRGRGNVTWSSYDKKPYKIKFDKKQALLDMPKSKHWVLRAFVEGSLDRYPDYLGTLLANLVGMKWTPTQRPCEVVLNGQYTGLYYLGESIRIESTRLNIYEQPEGETNEEIVKKGGYLAELSNYADDENSVRLDSKTPTWLAFNIHNPDNITEPQKEFLFDEFTKIDEALCQSNQNDNYAELIDSHSIAQFIAIQEILNNMDCFNGSLYLYKDTTDSHWYFGPLWDLSGGMATDVKQSFTYNDTFLRSVWLPQLIQNKNLRDDILTILESITEEEIIGIDNKLRQWASSMDEAEVQTRKVWKYFRGESLPSIRVEELIKKFHYNYELTKKLVKNFSPESTSINDIPLIDSSKNGIYNLQGIKINDDHSKGFYIHIIDGKAHKILL